MAVAAGAEVSGAKVAVDADSVAVAGIVSASSIQLTGEHVSVLAGATLSSNGGSILVGGDWQGSDGVRQALITTLADGATIDAGQGGTAVLWSDITNTKSVTTVAGTVRALGGRIETSGYLLELPGLVQAGLGGSWLIDPSNVVINTTSTTGSLAGDLANVGVTNIRAAGKDEAVRLTPPIRMTLERALAWIQDDELVEVTPKVVRLRKRFLDPHERKRESRKLENA